mmetsp:Transcript_3364/g.2815  ORF Transcript_3364/g.2815 Transcript_3364/m.2815 type:complete len:122 (+) Transcript_3364:1217-1582(+)
MPLKKRNKLKESIVKAIKNANKNKNLAIERTFVTTRSPDANRLLSFISPRRIKKPLKNIKNCSRLYSKFEEYKKMIYNSGSMKKNSYKINDDIMKYFKPHAPSDKVTMRRSKKKLKINMPY